MIVKKDATDILSESATAAYGMPLKVVYASKKDDLNGFAPSDGAKVAAASVTAPAQQTTSDSFDNSVDILKELSNLDGFSVEFKD